MSYEFYKVVHLTGIVMVFFGLGGVLTSAILKAPKDNAWRKPAAMTHGIGMLLALVGGFGLLARLQIVQFPWPAWVFGKVVIWLAAGAVMAPIRRRKGNLAVIWWTLPVLAALGAYLARYKP